MDTLFQGYKYPDGNKIGHKSVSAFSDRFKPNHPISDHNYEVGTIPKGSNPSDLVHLSGTNPELDTPQDVILKYIQQMLMEEEDLEHRPCMLHDCLALQAAEKSFYDVLGPKYPPPSVDNQIADSPNDNFTPSENLIETDSFLELDKFESTFVQPSLVDHNFGSISEPFGSYNTPFHVQDSYKVDPKYTQISEYSNRVVHLDEKNRRMKTRLRESECDEGGRSTKQLASYNEESEEGSEMYDSVLLSAPTNPLHPYYVLCDNGLSNGGRRRGKRQGSKKEVVDLRSLLNQCAQAVVSNDFRTGNELLSRIRQHSSPYGDGNERLAHFFANALEARLAASGTALYTAYASAELSAAEILKGYQLYLQACPFRLLPNFLANRWIRKLATNGKTLHVIDFGILYGFQWPCLIQRLTLTPSGPPSLRITGIELPQPGFRPEERVEATGRRLTRYCERFKVPFEYHGIAKKWETIQLEELKIDGDEVLIVNCLHRLSNVPDDTVGYFTPRDKVLNLIKRINPDLFILGVVNGTYNAPFFITRFRQALFHFSALFDMFEATVAREDHNRMTVEKEVFGKDVMNAIACEGTDRVDRPETYKQAQVRNVRAGFRQLPLDRDIMDYVRGYVKKGYHKDFVVDEDGHWMLQGWKGRISHAISCWKPDN